MGPNNSFSNRLATEITGEPRVLAAVERAMELTMKEYGPEGRSPFNLEENLAA